MSLSYDEIADILKIIDGSSCDELVLETPDTKLIVRRRSTASGSASADMRPSEAAPATTPAVSAPPRAAPAAPTGEGLHEGLHVVRAPMVGTFHRAPSPGAPPFVEVGQAVRKGDPLCLIEVMKLFTTIYAEIDGRVTEICAENAAPVEYGQMLFTIEPAG